MSEGGVVLLVCVSGFFHPQFILDCVHSFFGKVLNKVWCSLFETNKMMKKNYLQCSPSFTFHKLS
jgi:hypothetical protein